MKTVKTKKKVQIPSQDQWLLFAGLTGGLLAINRTITPVVLGAVASQESGIWFTVSFANWILGITAVACALISITISLKRISVNN